MSTHTASSPARLRGRRDGGRGVGPLAAVAILLLAFAVGALVIAAVVAAQAADEARDDVNSGGAVATSAHDHSAHDATAGQSLPLESFAGKTGANAESLAKAHAAYDATLPPVPIGRPGEDPHDPEGHGRRDRARREVHDLGVRRPRRAGADRSRARGPDRRDDADERRSDPALDRLPRRPHRAERRLQGRCPRRVLHLPLQGRRPGRLHVPLRHEARARAHRERDVRGARRRPGDAAPEGRQGVRARRRASGT